MSGLLQTKVGARPAGSPECTKPHIPASHVPCPHRHDLLVHCSGDEESRDGSHLQRHMSAEIQVTRTRRITRPGLPAKGMYKQAALHSVSYSVLRIVSANSPTVSWADFHLIKYGDIAVRMTLD